MSGRHAPSVAGKRRFPVLLTLATALGLWWGISAPEVSPVTPAPPPQVQPAGTTAVVPVVPPGETP